MQLKCMERVLIKSNCSQNGFRVVYLATFPLEYNIKIKFKHMFKGDSGKIVYHIGQMISPPINSKQ